jgi:hypothetical protein
MDSLWQLLENTYLLNPVSSLQTTVQAMLLAFILGQAIAWTYCWTHSGMSYSRSFTQMLVMIPIVIALVMVVIGNNIITAFGLIGALALIRFRNVLKDTRDTIFVFIALVVGMAAGSQRYASAIAGSLFLLTVLLYIHWTDFGSRGTFDGYLRCSMPADPLNDSRFNSVLARFCRKIRQVSTRQMGNQTIDLTYQVRLRDKRVNSLLVAELEKIEGIRNVSLILQEEMSEV